MHLALNSMKFPGNALILSLNGVDCEAANLEIGVSGCKAI